LRSANATAKRGIPARVCGMGNSNSRSDCDSACRLPSANENYVALGDNSETSAVMSVGVPALVPPQHVSKVQL